MNDESDMAPFPEHPGVAVVREVLSTLNWKFQESTDDAEDETTFLVDTHGDDLLASVKVVHDPGRVSIHGYAHLTIDATALPAAWKYIALFNNALQAGCLCVRDPAPAEVIIRTSVNYLKVPVLEEGLVAGAVADLIDIAEVSLEGLEAVSKGMDPDEAFDTYV